MDLRWNWRKNSSEERYLVPKKRTKSNIFIASVLPVQLTIISTTVSFAQHLRISIKMTFINNFIQDLPFCCMRRDDTTGRMTKELFTFIRHFVNQVSHYERSFLSYLTNTYFILTLSYWKSRHLLNIFPSFLFT